jgi:hypothetical protein
LANQDEPKTGINQMSTLNDRIAALRKQAAHAAEVWTPEPGESLVGELVGSQKAAGIYGENFQILIRDETDAIIAAWLTPWIKDNLEAKGAERGDLIALTFIGKKQSPSGRTYNAYSLEVEKL